jgi:hypothetical protein
MRGRGRRLLVAVAVGVCATWGHAAPQRPDFGAERASDDARYAASRIVEDADNAGRPFVIVDKKEARVYVFAPHGHLLGASAALLGLAPGDRPVGDSANASPASLAPSERTTPAGRFDSEPGHNDKGEAIVWIDYAAALAIHRLRPAPARDRRPQRMASPDPGEHRISFGCVVVPVEFYEQVVEPTLGSRRGVVYVLPEASPVQAMFDTLEARLDIDLD